MKLKLTWLLTLFMAFVMQLSFGQERDITGTITTASDGLPLPGVTVLVKGTVRGTQTDFDGNYSIKASTGDVLTYSYVGTKTTEKTVGAESTINVALEDDVAALDEVVVIANITQTREKSTVASVMITSEVIANRPNASLIQTLNGQVAGLNITTTNGQPGGNSTVNIRGIGSINGDTEPLFIMDGVPIDQDNFRSLNPEDVASVTVLKDAGATAIYGNRGANGVIVITTKRGSFNEGLKVGYNGFMSFNSIQGDDYNRMNSQQLLTYERERGRGAGAGTSTGKFNPGNGSPMTDGQIAAAPNFNWEDYFFRTGITQSHNVSLSSGGENASQFTSFAFTDNEGILENSSLKRFNIRNNITGKSNNGKFNYATNITMNYSRSDSPTSVGSSGINQNFILGAISGVPYITSGDYSTGANLLSPLSFTNTPLFLQDKLLNETNIDEEIKLVASLSLSYQLTDWLSANMTMGGDYQNVQLTAATPPTTFNAILFGGAENPTAGSQTMRSTRQFIFNNITSLNAQKTFGKHTVGAGLFTEYNKNHFRQFGVRAEGLNPSTFAPGDGSGLVQQAGGLFNDEANAEILNTGLFSYFGQADYDYDSRYGASVTVRRDASSRFTNDYQWGTFWAASARWNISNEKFMQGSVINTLKLRGSYGETGNQFISGGLFGATDNTLDLFRSGGGYGNLNSLQLGQIGVRDLRWETVAQANIGIDFGVWNNRLRGSFDVYEKKTSDLFQSAPLSATVGVTRLNVNTGVLFNRGVDFQASYDLIRSTKEGGLNLTVGFLGNFNETELQDLPNSDGEIIQGGAFSAGLGRNGGELGEFYGLRFAGVNPASGELQYLDVNGNVTESPNQDTDRVWLGENGIPEWTGAFNLDVDYKGFFLTTQWAYAVGIDREDNDYANLIRQDNIGQFNFSNDVTTAWSQPGDVTNIPSPTAVNRNTYTSDRFLTSSDFLRLRFASFGYNFSRKMLEGLPFDKVSIFVNGENLLTFTEWRGFDPEGRSFDIGNGSTQGRQFPTPRTVSFGLQLGF